MKHKNNCEDKIQEAIQIFHDTFCKRCEECCGGDDCPMTLLLEGRVNIFGNSVFNPEDDLVVVDEDIKRRAKEVTKKIIERGRCR